LLDNSASFTSSRKKEFVKKTEGETNFSRLLKQLDGLTRLILAQPQISRQIYNTVAIPGVHSITFSAVWLCRDLENAWKMRNGTPRLMNSAIDVCPFSLSIESRVNGVPVSDGKSQTRPTGCQGDE